MSMKVSITLPEGFIPEGYEFVRIGPVIEDELYVESEGYKVRQNKLKMTEGWYVIVRKIQKPKWPERLRDWPAVAYAIDEDGHLWVYEKVPESCPYWSTNGEEYFLPREFIPEFYPNGVPDWKDSLVKREDCE